MTARNRTGIAVLATTAAVVFVAGAQSVASQGPGEEATRLFIRQTARISVVLFCAAFAASSAFALWPAPLTRWTLRNRRWLGLSFALSHLAHLAAIVHLTEISSEFEIATTSLVFGGLAYAFIAAMAATSFDGAIRRLGRTNWHRLHKTGSYYVWTLFAISYFPRAAESPWYTPPAALLLLALTARSMAHRSQRSAVGGATQHLRKQPAE